MKKLLLLILLFPALAFADTVQYGGGGQASNVTFSPDGSIAATNVQDAIVEVRDEAGSGSVATDTIFDAAGDLVYGTGSDTSARLAAGATTDILVGGGAAAPVWTAATGTGAPARAGSPTFTGTVGAAAITATGLGTFDSLSTTEFTVSDAGAVVAASYSTAASATPGWTFYDSDNDDGTASIYGTSSGGTNAIIMTLGVEEAGGSNAGYIEVDGVAGTVDVLKPLVASSWITGLARVVAIGNSEGVHDGGDAAATLGDSGESLTVDAYIGMTLYNITDVSSCTVTDNDGTSITCTLSGGTDDDWDDGDVWMVGPGPTQSGSIFFLSPGATNDIVHPATAGYMAIYYTASAQVIEIRPAASGMTLNFAADGVFTDPAVNNEVDGDGTIGDFIGFINASATEAYSLGVNGTYADGAALDYEKTNNTNRFTLGLCCLG